MLALGCNNIVMGRQSRLGPIDAQLSQDGRQISAGAVRARLEQAAAEIIEDPQRAHIWAPLHQILGSSLLQNRMFRGQPRAHAHEVAADDQIRACQAVISVR